MKYLAAKHPLGIFTFAENGSLVDHKLFSKNAEEALKEFESDSTDDSVEAHKILRKSIRHYANSLAGMGNKEFNQFMSDFGILLSRKRMHGLTGRDRLIIQASKALEDMDKSLNLFIERLNEWYRLHYPEVKISQKELVNKVIEHGKRENFPGYIESVGVHLSEEDEKIIREYASLIKEKHDRKIKMENYIRNSMKEIAPNTSSLIDAFLAARLLTLAGSLEKLARMPASSIQLLGAEKALFRHIKKQGKSPKYGILFQDSRIQSAPPENRGKIARLISSKLMQAARIDFYSGRFEPSLKKGLEDELKAVK